VRTFFTGIKVIRPTTWLWTREEYRDSVDVLMVDEAGQMSLASVNACTISYIGICENCRGGLCHPLSSGCSARPALRALEFH
jgi:hypothetical protein